MYPVSKTDYLLFRECPKNAWLKIHRPDIYYSKELSAFEKSIIETGNDVESVARGLFPTGIMVEGRDHAARETTSKHIASHEKTLFQPVFLRDNFLAAIDILRYDDETDKYSIYEIKASNQIKEKLHIFDLAFQVNLMKKVGLRMDKAYLLHLDPKYVRNGELEITKLFAIDDVTDTVDDILEVVLDEMNRALEYLSSEKEPSGQCDCVYRGRSGHCTTFSYSNPHIPKYSVHDIARIGLSKSKLTELIDGNIFHLHEVPEGIELSEIQRNQINTHISGRPIIRVDKISEELRGLNYPLYFLDYETFPAAIPRFDGFSPYQQIPFQYSLHVVRSPKDEPEHFEFLHTDTDDPSPHLARVLMKDIGRVGTVIVWNKKFESKINTELARRLPVFGKFIEDVNGRIYDLMDIFSKQYYVHKDFYGSTSIKYVLPVLAPELSYKKLDIQEGGTATQKWNEMVTGDISESQKKTIAKHLKTYCKLDTFAMYRIWKCLKNSVTIHIEYTQCTSRTL